MTELAGRLPDLRRRIGMAPTGTQNHQIGVSASTASPQTFWLNKAAADAWNTHAGLHVEAGSRNAGQDSSPPG
jgi:hypothetical protein